MEHEKGGGNAALFHVRKATATAANVTSSAAMSLALSGSRSIAAAAITPTTGTSSVPIDAVVREGDGTMTVWVTSDGRRFNRRSVKIGMEQNGWRQILDGVAADEKVASTGAIFLSNKFANAATG